MASLRGKTIAITEARRAAELSALIVKLGGVPRSAPAVREVPRRDQGPALAVLDRIGRGQVDVIVFLTGVGARALLALAAQAGRRDALLRALPAMVVVARGPKPVAVLREAGVRIDLTPREPTSEGLLDALASRELRGTTVAVQLYGEDNPMLVQGLAERGATVLEIPLYEWAPPEDEAPLERLVHELVGGHIDVVAFTSSPQIRNLLSVAARLGLRDQTLAALRDKLVVAVVGPVCEATLREHGIQPQIKPGKGTMGALVHSIADHLAHEEREHGHA